MSLAQYADPLEGFMAEWQLGRRGTVQTIVPDGDECDHIAALLRKGCIRGVGILKWELRTAPGVRFPQDILDKIAADVEECFMSGEDPCWRIEIRR